MVGVSPTRTRTAVPVTYRILPSRGLVYVHYEGHASLAETAALLERYIKDPDWRPGQKQLVDLEKVTSHDRDFVALMALQARKVDAFLPAGRTQTLLVYYAPSEAGFEMARLAVAAWRGVSGVVASVQREAAGALDILGQPERDMAALLALAR